MKKDVVIKNQQPQTSLEKKYGDLLPKITLKILPNQGAICAQKVKCGKSNCKCAKGSLHEGYHYRFYYKNGKLKKQYIKKADVQAAVIAYSEYKEQKRSYRAAIESGRRDYKKLFVTLKELTK